MDVVDRLNTALSDRYRIEREIGSGGMATVYLAQDLKHRRNVAIKVLNPDLAQALGADRFLREIEIAANLHHPHVLPLYDSGEDGGFLYYVMPYEEGQSVRERLVKEGELPVQEAVRLLRDVADALAHAHQKGVVHRDIKPDNVLLSGRHALVTDFGVAKAVSEATGRHQLTTTGVAVGTPAYMAPEQAAGEENIDHRADIYAFGALAYELLTGKPPFTGPSSQAVLAAHVTEAPVPVTTNRASVPPALEALIMRCLEKKPADRWQSAEEMIPHLEALATPSGGITPTDTRPVSAQRSPGGRPRAVNVAFSGAAILLIAAGAWFLRGLGGPEAGESSIAVLFFENLSADSADAYLIEGLTEDIATSLGQVEGVQVKAPGAVRRAQRAQGDDAVTLGEFLGVRYILGGSFRQTAVGLRIVARVVDPRTEVTVWNDTYDRSGTDMLSLPSEIAADVAATLFGDLDEAARSRMGQRLTENPAAYDAYLRGNFRFGRRNRTMLNLALDDYERAVRLDPAFAAARARIAMSYALMYDYGWVPDTIIGDTLLARGLSIADSLLERDPDLADAWHAKSMLSLYAGRHIDEALAAIERAVAIAPDHIEAHNLYGWMLLFSGRFTEAEREAWKAHELDPGWLMPFNQLGYSAFYQGRLAEAEALFDSTLARDPAFRTAYVQRAQVRLLLADTAGALEDAAELERLGSSGSPVIIRAAVDAMAGRRARASHVADSLMALDDPSCLWTARLLVTLNENERAIGLLERCAPQLDGEQISALLSPFFDPLRDDRRFQALVRWGSGR